MNLAEKCTEMQYWLLHVNIRVTIGNNLWTSFCNDFLVSVLSLYFSAASCMNPDKNNLLYFNKQAVYMGYLWHPFVPPIMILPVLLNAWYGY